MMVAIAIVLGLVDLLLWSNILYKQFFKRFYDIVLSGIAIIVLFPLLLVLTIVGAIKMKGNPFFVQPRPGKNERIFNLIKFRSMTCEKDKDGNDLPDDVRLTSYGKKLRSTSLDELPELFNILKGDMSIVGPRPQLVRDMVFMTEKQRMRHSIKPGLTGLAQVKGRNAVTWEEKLDWDFQYLEQLSFLNDVKVLFATIAIVFKQDGITDGENATALDLGDALLVAGKVSKEEYGRKQIEAKQFLEQKG